MPGNHPYAPKSTLNSPRVPLLTGTPSARNAAACLVAPPGPLCCFSYGSGSPAWNGGHWPWGYDALGTDNSLPRDIVRVKKMVAATGIGWKMLQANAYLTD